MTWNKNRDSDNWLRKCIVGESAAHILATLSILDGEWKEKDDTQGITWQYFDAITNAQLYLRMLEPWKIG